MMRVCETGRRLRTGNEGDVFRFSIVAVVLLVAAGLLQGCTDDCSSLRDEARALRDEAEACSAGDTCVLVNMYEMAGENNCLLAFQCEHALNARTDLAAFRAAALIIDGYYRSCIDCVMAQCTGTETLTARCDEAGGRCVLTEAAP